MIDLAGDPVRDFETVRAEIAAFDPELAKRPALVVLNKMDLVSADQAESAARAMRAHTGMEVLTISAQHREGIAPLVAAIARTLKTIDRQAECRN